MKQEPLPQIYHVKDTDIPRFAYMLHVLAGDFLRESEFNMRTLATEVQPDTIAIMGKNHMWLHDALAAYRTTADLHQMIFTTEYIGARAFLFHADRIENGHQHGDILMMDLDTLRKDVKAFSKIPFGVSAQDKDGQETVVSLEKWHAMEPYEKLALKSWGVQYAPETMAVLREHYAEVFDRWKSQEFTVSNEYLEERLNIEYMNQAQNPDLDKYRIPLAAAKKLLLYDEAPVYRLLPAGAEKIPPIAAVTTGLWYEYYREFAITPEDLGALDQLCDREVERLMGSRPEKNKVKTAPAPER